MATKKHQTFPRTLVIGASGLVGSRFVQLSELFGPNTLTPSHQMLDLTSAYSLNEYIKVHKPQAIINFATVIAIDETEKQRNDTGGSSWRTNVLGVNNLIQASKKYNYFLIQISTNAVFPGTQKQPGPYKESDPPSTNDRDISWYGYTKLMAEKNIMKNLKKYAIIRISHPFGNLSSEKDMIHKTIATIKSGQEVFVDQLFTPTFIPDVVHTIDALLRYPAVGLFHVACADVISRFDFTRHLAKILNLKEPIKQGSMKQFLSEKGHAPRTRLGGLQTTLTQKMLGLTFTPWEQALESLDDSQGLFLCNYKSKFSIYRKIFLSPTTRA